VAFNKAIAASIAESALARWRKEATYAELAAMEAEGRKRVVEVVAEDGRRYSVEKYTLPDLDGSIRMVVAVDDGGWSAWVPLSRDEIMRPDGSFID
jgi:hypothetical protein